ncbi:hypothetical protein B0H17DRAFT_1198217 [Mycena rosella]|uniref:Uncharacterized protein n=1 Tax=Mycena rosella TaxID=1033263 RepID=A0AAD7GNN1_MYCRO|nr:hypothetical protein B0H17DRAFT_1198217 [Mycena rosella]
MPPSAGSSSSCVLAPRAASVVCATRSSREKLYIGEACWAFLFGVVIGPYGANIFNPRGWASSGALPRRRHRRATLTTCRSPPPRAPGLRALPRTHRRSRWRSPDVLRPRHLRPPRAPNPRQRYHMLLSLPALQISPPPSSSHACRTPGRSRAFAGAARVRRALEDRRQISRVQRSPPSGLARPSPMHARRAPIPPPRRLALRRASIPACPTVPALASRPPPIHPIPLPLPLANGASHFCRLPHPIQSARRQKQNGYPLVPSGTAARSSSPDPEYRASVQTRHHALRHTTYHVNLGAAAACSRARAPVSRTGADQSRRV